MLTNDYLRIRGAAEGVSQSQGQSNTAATGPPGQSDFANELRKRIAAESGSDSQVTRTTAEELAVMSGVNFSRHAVDRINQRQIDVTSDNTLSRLSKGVELAESKGSDDALVIVDKTAFLVSVRSNKVITAVSSDDMAGSVFTNIDATVIM